MSLARYLASLLNSSGQVPDAKLVAMAASKLTGQVPDANAPSGSVIQVAAASTSTSVSTTSSSYVDTGLSCTITPSSASSKIIVLAQLAIYEANNASNRDEAEGFLVLVKNGSIVANSGLQSGVTSFSNSKRFDYLQTYNWYDIPTTTSALTYKIQMRTSGWETITAQRNGYQSCMTLLEIAA